MVRFSRERYIDAAPEQVWAVLSDYPNVYRWAPIVKHSRQVSPNAQGEGATRACEVPGFGELTETIERWEEGRGFSFLWEATGPVKGGRSTWTVSRDGVGSRVRVAIEAEMRHGFIGELMGQTFLKLQMGRLMADALKGLEYFVHTGEVVQGDVARRLRVKAA